MHTVDTKKMLLLRPEDIIPPDDQIRKTFNEYEESSLSQSVLANGIIVPLLVRHYEKNKYILISGVRRLRAAKTAGLRRVPCIVHKTDRKDAVLYSLIENIQTTPINFFEQAQAIERLISRYKLTKTEISISLGIPQSAVKAKLRLLKIDEPTRQRILGAGLTEQHALALLKLDKKDIPFVLDTVIGKDLNAKQTEELVNLILRPEPKTEELPEPVRKSSISDVKLFSNSLSKLIKTMKSAGIDASSQKSETEDYITYEVKIEKRAGRQLNFYETIS